MLNKFLSEERANSHNKKMQELEQNIENLNNELRESMDSMIEKLNGGFDITEKNLIHFTNYLNDIVLFVNENFEIYHMNDRAQKCLQLEKNEENHYYGFVFDIFVEMENSPSQLSSSEFIGRVLRDQVEMFNKTNDGEGSPPKTNDEFERTQFYIKTIEGIEPVFISISMQNRTDGSNYYIMILKEVSWLNYLSEHYHTNQENNIA